MNIKRSFSKKLKFTIVGNCNGYDYFVTGHCVTSPILSGIILAINFHFCGLPILFITCIEWIGLHPVLLPWCHGSFQTCSGCGHSYLLWCSTYNDMLENTVQGSAQEKVGGQELLILNLVLMYQLLCFFRVIQLFST